MHIYQMNQWGIYKSDKWHKNMFTHNFAILLCGIQANTLDTDWSNEPAWLEGCLSLDPPYKASPAPQNGRPPHTQDPRGGVWTLLNGPNTDSGIRSIKAHRVQEWVKEVKHIWMVIIQGTKGLIADHWPLGSWANIPASNGSMFMGEIFQLAKLDVRGRDGRCDYSADTIIGNHS